MPRPDWQPVDVREKDNSWAWWKNAWPSCETTEDCTEGTVCVDHMWAYNGQTESGRGCWAAAVCKGNGAYDMFDGRKLQYFCSQDEKDAAASMSAPFGLTAASAAHFDTFEVACAADADCPDPA